MDKLIITVAPTGSVPQKDTNPNVPITPVEIAEDGARCLDAGASIIHIHARENDGANTTRIEVFADIVDHLKTSAPKMIRQISTGGRAGAGFAARSERLTLNPEMASLSTGSTNFPTQVYENSPQLIDSLAAMMKERNIKPEMEIFDTAMIPNAIGLVNKNLADVPLHFNFVMGLPGSIPAEARYLAFLADSIPSGSTWCVSGIGRHQLNMAAMAIVMGGHVRVGLEDNTWYAKGDPASNVRLVERIVRLAKELGRDIAEPDQTRALLSLPAKT